MHREPNRGYRKVMDADLPDYFGQILHAELIKTMVHRISDGRLRQWLCRKHKVSAGKTVRFAGERLWKEWRLTRLGLRTVSFPWPRV
ncbi:MAG: hypothetical protein OXT71_07345 [Acidobacteriota bacterium]|nr:hypothetical protein [Acidobacteriota bacterium]